MTWREAEQRERQQRSVRTLMMFLLMLLLMDGEEQQNLERRKRKEELRQKQQRMKELNKSKQKLPFELWDARQRQDTMVRDRIRYVPSPEGTGKRHGKAFPRARRALPARGNAFSDRSGPIRPRR